MDKINSTKFTFEIYLIQWLPSRYYNILVFLFISVYKNKKKIDIVAAQPEQKKTLYSNRVTEKWIRSHAKLVKRAIHNHAPKQCFLLLLLLFCFFWLSSLYSFIHLHIYFVFLLFC